MRGIASIAKAVAPVAASALVPAPLVSGARKPTSTDSPVSAPSSWGWGGATLATTSAGPGAVADRGARRGVELVGDAGDGARAALEHDLVALARELAHDVGHERDAPLALDRLFRDADLHERGNLPIGQS